MFHSSCSLDRTLQIGRFVFYVPIGLDKRGYQVNIFLISPRKHYVVGTREKHLGESRAPVA